jgi:hypothetical protein
LPTFSLSLSLCLSPFLSYTHTHTHTHTHIFHLSFMLYFSHSLPSVTPFNFKYLLLFSRLRFLCSFPTPTLECSTYSQEYCFVPSFTSRRQDSFSQSRYSLILLARKKAEEIKGRKQQKKNEGNCSQLDTRDAWCKGRVRFFFKKIFY